MRLALVLVGNNLTAGPSSRRAAAPTRSGASSSGSYSEEEEGTVSGFIELISADEVPLGTMKAVELEDHELLVAHVGAGFLVADARCPHLGGHLPDGVLEGSVVTCPRHHSQFDLTDGHVIRWTDWKGAVLTLAELARHPRPLRVYETEVVEGKVLVGAEKPPAVTP
jgi:3-phenylpropionate/trans-cinnamate dioxygenase ferredoxin subunit